MQIQLHNPLSTHNIRVILKFTRHEIIPRYHYSRDHGPELIHRMRSVWETDSFVIIDIKMMMIINYIFSYIISVVLHIDIEYHTTHVRAGDDDK